MNDPHVVELIYQVKHGDAFNYDNAGPLRLSDQKINDCEFDLVVEDQEARFKFKTHHASESQARKAIEEYIRAWEFNARLERDDPDCFRLEFNRSKIKDRAPSPGVHEAHLSASFRSGVPTFSASVTVSPRSYPAPPSDIGQVNPYIETMFHRYMSYCRDRSPENLTSMAYFCLTVLEDRLATAKRKLKPREKRQQAAKENNVQFAVLDNIGRLASRKGGQDARKAGGIDDDLTQHERRFLEQAVRKMIRRAAEKTRDPSKTLPEISLSDLPQI